MPASCPRCEIASGRMGSDWCCWELKKLQDLMNGAEPPTMGEMLRVHFIGRSPGSIDRTCRRYDLKIPVREKRERRKRCPGCGGLIEKAKACAACTPAPALELRAA